jgi:hypothetical protein
VLKNYDKMSAEDYYFPFYAGLSIGRFITALHLDAIKLLEAGMAFHEDIVADGLVARQERVSMNMKKKAMVKP